MKKLFLMILVIPFLSCSSSSDTMTEYEALLAFYAVSCAAGSTCECITGDIESDDDGIVFDSCEVNDPLCETSGTITINGNLTQTSGTLTFSGMVDKECVVSSQDVLCGINITEVSYSADEICEALNL